jgi:beta-galactosidase
MTIASFNDGWTVGPKTSIYAALQGAGAAGEPVTLPHDALISTERSAERGRADVGFFTGGAFTYTKSFAVPEEWRGKRVTLEFQGAYRDAVVFLNDDFAAQRPNGYSTFYVALDPFLRYDTDNTVTVEVRTEQDSRWYTGAGLYRDVRLHVTDLVHITPTGVTISTPDVDDDRAVVEIATTIRNQGTGSHTVQLRTELRDPDGVVVAADLAPVTVRAGELSTARQRMYVPRARRWDVETPELYAAASILTDGDRQIDFRTTSFGIRTLQLDPAHGLRVNGRSVKLRGACIHHDNGLLGAATIAAAEERRVKVLKEAGFNAIRSAHNPLSPAMLDACDRLGMLVMDELTDVWTVSKSTNDYSLAFPEWWERDVEAMVEKDINHPSVIMYSIGNENPETGSALGARWSRDLAEKVRSLDESRFVTNGVNGFVAAIKEVAVLMQQHAAVAAAAEDQGVNGAMNMGDFMNQVSASPQVTEKTAEAFSALDVAGMNYSDARYALDKDLFPNRIIVGSETFPSHIHENWAQVLQHSHVIGDFTWTGWDYLGEAGAGRITYLDGEGGVPAFEAGFPWLTSWTGDIDITGVRRPVSYYREIVFGLRDEPYIAVQRPETFGKPFFAGQWSWSDTVAGWSWDTPGARTCVEVYSDADEVELLLNGQSLGRQPAGRDHAYKATFDVAFESGELQANALRDGTVTGTSMLRSATGRTVIHAEPEETVVAADTRDLAYIPVTFEDVHGNLVHADDRELTVTIGGPGELKAVGSGRPDQTERFDTGTHTTYDGRALVIVRPTGTGTITVSIAAPGVEPVVVRIEATEGATVAAPASAPREDQMA